MNESMSRPLAGRCRSRGQRQINLRLTSSIHINWVRCSIVYVYW